MGSLLALRLALDAPQRVAALILISNALWLASPYPTWPMQWARRLRCPDLLIPKPSSDLGDPDGHAHHATYTAQPLHAAIEVLRAAEVLRPRLREIRCPVLILHGAQDQVCPVRNAWRTAERLGSTDIKVVVFAHSHHILNWDFDREQLRAELGAFLQRWAPSPAALQTPVEP
jgi:pimeloyl-ACP methyl ester carboxylesterase